MRPTRIDGRSPAQNFEICLALCLALCLLPAALSAQTQGRREALLAEVQAQQTASSEAASIFANRSLSEEERAAAARRVSAFIAPDDLAAASRVFLNPDEPPTLRALALARIEHAVDRDPALVTAVLELAAKPQASKELRDQAVAILSDLAFSSLAMRERSAEILPIFRSLTQDRDESLRLLAFGTLAANGDDFAEQRLIECLRSPASAAPLPTRDCVRFLGLQLHGDALPALHEILLNPPDEDSRIEAIRLLGGFPASRPKLMQILADPAETSLARLTVLATLNANDPAGFPAVALPLLRDEGLPDEIRLYGLQAVRQKRLAGVRTLPAAAPLAPFDDMVRKLARGSKSPAVRNAAQEYLRDLQLEEISAPPAQPK